MKSSIGRRVGSAVFVGLLLSAQGAFAAGSLDTLIAQINFVDVLAAIMSIGVLVIGVDLATIGYLKVRRLVKGAH